jgi:hypothetical protein
MVEPNNLDGGNPDASTPPSTPPPVLPPPSLFTDKQVDKISETTHEIVKEIFGTLRDFVEKRYTHDKSGLWVFGGIVLCILITLLFLGYFKILAENSISPILGSLVGYALGKFSNSNNDKR